MRDKNGFIAKKVSELEAELELILAKARSRREFQAVVPAPAPAPDAGQSEVQAGRHPQADWFPYLLATRPKHILVLPFIYGMILPLVVLDLCVTIYQSVCFRLFGIERIRKSDYIALERHDLGYLNAIEKINCDYCAYANGLIGFAREILARTEQYWCPIKHAHKILGTHDRYALFLDYGNADEYRKKLEALRAALSRSGS